MFCVWGGMSDIITIFFESCLNRFEKEHVCVCVCAVKTRLIQKVVSVID